MNKKVLFVATVLQGHVLLFHLPCMRWFQQQGYEVHLACHNDTDHEVTEVPYCDRYFNLPFARSPFNMRNVGVYKQLKQLVKEHEYALIHCHTPVGAMLGRLSARKARKKGTRVVYSAHGFHFFKGAPLKNWLLFYPAEWLTAHWTDLLITTNEEDAQRAERLPAKKKVKVNGVGVDLTRFDPPADRREARDLLGIPQDAQVLMTVGEHSVRKNHATLLRAAAQLPGVRVVLCGWGEGKADLEKLADTLGITDRVQFLGFRNDLPKVYPAADVFVFPSLHEGLPVALMEAMASGLPAVVSNARGCVDLIQQDEGGFLRDPMDVDGFAKDIHALLEDPALRERMGAANRITMQGYSLPDVMEKMGALYREQLQETGIIS
ncbi:MAG: glycosyltransferase family 4 protein [Clostridia bacterium]|nr:glycosyltransferase family 4 protein [Clostridia bacterium]